MTRKKLAVTIGVLFLVTLLGGAAIGWLIWQQRSLPVYEMGELPPSEGYAVNTLTRGNVTYVSSKAEFRLLPLHAPLKLALAIGRTSDDLRVFRPDGQPGQDYIYVNGEMMPEVVYRDSRLAPLYVTDLRVREMRMPVGNSGLSPKSTRDEELIAEVLASLATPPSVVHPDYDGGDRNCRLEFLPEQMPGLAYTVDTLIDKTGRVYLSTEAELGQDIWIPAGPLFAQWARQ